MNILYSILATPFIIWFFFWWTFGGRTKRPPAAKYWQCSAPQLSDARGCPQVQRHAVARLT